MNILFKIFLAIGVLGLSYFLSNGDKFLFKKDADLVVKKEILQGATFSVMASETGVATDTANAILDGAKKVYNLASIAAGKKLEFVYDKNGALKELVYEIDRDEKLSVKNLSTTTAEYWQAGKTPIEDSVKIDSAKGVIENSLYQTIVEQNLDERLALALAETFAWQIDFAAQIQKGDSFKVIYEKKYRDGVYSHPGKILAAEFNNYGEKFQGFYYESENTKAGYYDENSNSVQKVFLKAPLQYKYISSGFSYARLNPITNQVSPHRGIDYAAPAGTPAVSVGGGTVVQAGWNRYYGISVKVRHNEMYTTVYGHFSSLAKGIRVGTKVAQGQIVGYVGSTGLSTGPHLHYEMHKFGALINPFKEKIPPGEPVNEKDKAAFEAVKKKYQKELNNL